MIARVFRPWHDRESLSTLARRFEAACAHALIQLAKTDESQRHPCENGGGASGEIDRSCFHGQAVEGVSEAPTEFLVATAVCTGLGAKSPFASDASVL